MKKIARRERNVSKQLYYALEASLWFSQDLLKEVRKGKNKEKIKKLENILKSHEEEVSGIIKNCLPNDEDFRTTLNIEYSNLERFVFDVLVRGHRSKSTIMVFAFGRLNGIVVNVDYLESKIDEEKDLIKEIYENALEADFDHSAKWYQKILTARWGKVKDIKTTRKTKKKMGNTKKEKKNSDK